MRKYIYILYQLEIKFKLKLFSVLKKLNNLKIMINNKTKNKTKNNNKNK